MGPEDRVAGREPQAQEELSREGDEGLRRRIEATLESQGGVLFALPALVGRAMYTGRDILAKNSRNEPGYLDARGYATVEWWIMSRVPAANERPLAHEGISRLCLFDGSTVLLTEAARVAAERLFGRWLALWPLAKILDIGGEPVRPDFGPFGEGPTEPEVPPIPVHVHAGEVVGGRLRPPGKLESYFFPPVDVPPYRRELAPAVTRLGLKPRVRPEQVVVALREFGWSDAMYALSEVYPIRPYEGWLVPPRTLHAPGPWPTLELQLPQDDFQLAAWKLGERLGPDERYRLRERLMLRGLRDEQDFLDQAVDWQVCTAPDFAARFRRQARVIESGAWGRRLQIFFAPFYGEALELRPGGRYVRPPGSEPWAGVVWSGQGLLGRFRVSAEPGVGYREFLVTPGTEAELVADGPEGLHVYALFPMRHAG